MTGADPLPVLRRVLSANTTFLVMVSYELKKMGATIESIEKIIEDTFKLFPGKPGKIPPVIVVLKNLFKVLDEQEKTILQ